MLEEQSLCLFLLSLQISKMKKKAAFKRKMCVKEVKWHNSFVFLAVWVFITFETLWFSMFKNRKTWFSSIFWVAKTDTKIFCLFEFNWIIIKNLLKQFQQILQKENYQRLISGYYFYQKNIPRGNDNLKKLHFLCSSSCFLTTKETRSLCITFIIFLPSI